jgi:hypothetical protein
MAMANESPNLIMAAFIRETQRLLNVCGVGVHKPAACKSHSASDDKPTILPVSPAP